jgi:hypothetical protein
MSAPVPSLVRSFGESENDDGLHDASKKDASSTIVNKGTIEIPGKILPNSTKISHLPQNEEDLELFLTSSQATFPMKLFHILMKNEYAHIVSWMPHGKSWMILNPKEFEKVVIPLYFNHKSISSFVRQVNGWNFKKKTVGEEKNSYFNEYFLRERPELLENMARQPCKKVRKKTVASSSKSYNCHESTVSEDAPKPRIIVGRTSNLSYQFNKDRSAVPQLHHTNHHDTRHSNFVEPGPASNNKSVPMYQTGRPYSQANGNDTAMPQPYNRAHNVPSSGYNICANSAPVFYMHKNVRQQQQFVDHGPTYSHVAPTPNHQYSTSSFPHMMNNNGNFHSYNQQWRHPAYLSNSGTSPNIPQCHQRNCYY